MNRSTLNTAALVDLKAELLRKREIANQLKQHRDANIEPTAFRLKHEKPKTSAPGNPALLKQSIFDEDAEEERKALQKSREMLEKKTKLYEKISKGEKILDEDENERYLVDFGRKADWKSNSDHRDEVNDENTNRPQEEDYPCPEIISDDKDWVDYVDNRGNRKRCLRDDLPLFQSAEHLNNQGKKSKAFWENIDSKSKPTVVPSNPIEEEDVEKEIGPVHYENVRHNEVRSHGVGYFAFSESEDQRKEQLDMLNNMRDQTVKQREMRQRMKEKRDALLAARLAKVKQRKNITSDELNLDSDEDILVEDIPLPEEPEGLKEDDEVLRKVPAKVRPWDKGKNFSESRFNMTSQDKLGVSTKNYYEERRSDRQSDFAPPNLYFQSKRKQTNRAPWSEKPQQKPAGDAIQHDASDFDTSDGTGSAPQQNASVPQQGMPVHNHNPAYGQPGMGPPMQFSNQSNFVPFGQPGFAPPFWPQQNTVPPVANWQQNMQYQPPFWNQMGAPNCGYNYQNYAAGDETQPNAMSNDDGNHGGFRNEPSVEDSSTRPVIEPKISKEDIEEDVAQKLKFFRNKM